VTAPGRLLRRTHLDEVPQLWNVVRGEMRLVGPRPEDARYIDMGDPVHRRVFTAKPGITGLTQLVYAREAEFLDPTNPDAHYLEKILPGKVALDARYLDLRSPSLDAWILFQTVLTALGRPPTPHEISERFGVRYGLGEPLDAA
jgi:lipopolysaccharide/colanic/teichoic acid biosynthesis glycosyltransferase